MSPALTFSTSPKVSGTIAQPQSKEVPTSPGSPSQILPPENDHHSLAGEQVCDDRLEQDPEEIISDLSWSIRK